MYNVELVVFYAVFAAVIHIKGLDGIQVFLTCCRLCNYNRKVKV